MTDHKAAATSSSDFFTELKHMLVEEITLNEKLREVLKQKQQTIIQNNLEELRHCIEDEQSLMQATKDKAQLLEEYIKNGAPEATKPSLKEIIKNAPEELQPSLERGRQRLITCLEEISQLNRENRFLLNFSLEHIKGVIHLLLKSEDENAKLYNYRGHIFLTEKNHKTLNVQI